MKRLSEPRTGRTSGCLARMRSCSAWPAGPSRLFLAVLLCGGMAVADTPTSRPSIHPLFESAEPARPHNRVDDFVFAKFSALNIRPVLCSDEVFVRRAFLDILGVLPTAEEARAFLQDPDRTTKRQRLVEQLLERPEFAEYWAMRWSDILRIKAEFPVNLWPNAAQAYHRWVLESLAANKPYDRFARELLTSSGSNFRVAPVNFYRAIQNRTPDGIAAAVALTFMGTRTDTWPSNQLAGFSAFFAQVGYKPTSEWKEEIVFWDPLGASRMPANVAPGRDNIVTTNRPVGRGVPTNLPPRMAVFPDGRRIALPPDRDPREVLADWLISPNNPWFGRVVVNRIWYWLMGRGIVHEPDDFRPDNPPSHPELLDYLSRQLAGANYDLKHVYRLILTSATYQLSSVPRDTRPEASAAFAAYPIRRLDAEVLIDAINQVTGTSDLYTSPIPEPFTYIPADLRAVAIGDGSITSPFLALFGRTARATGMESERDNRPMPAQWRHLLNSSHIQRKLETGPKLRTIWEGGRSTREVIENLYLAILSRYPTADEVKTVEAHLESAGAAPVASDSRRDGRGGGRTRSDAAQRRRDAWVDVVWALLNSNEFLFRH